MKRIKKIVSIMLTLAMVMSMSVITFAASPDPGRSQYIINITGKTAGHTYAAYQIFSGDLIGSQQDGYKLSNIVWGNGVKLDETVNGKTLMQALAADVSLGMTADMTPREVAEKLATFKEDDDAAKVQAFSDIIGQYLKDESGRSTETEGTTYTIDVGKQGYYFVKDVGNIGATASKTDYILEVVGPTNLTTKDTIVTISKNIVEISSNGGIILNDANTAGIGDDVTYQLTSKVPDHTAYEEYYFVITDTLDNGLTFNNDLKVKIGDATLELNKDYYLYINGTGNELVSVNEVPAGNKMFKIAFANIKSYTKDTPIIITYSAQVNGDAAIGTAGNKNKVSVNYSEDPNYKNPEKPDDKPGIPDSDKNIPMGETPEDIVTTFVTQLQIFKTKDNQTDALEGAEFTLTGFSTQTDLSSGDHYIQDPTGTYYQLKALKDGKVQYTDKVPQTVATMVKAPDHAKAGYVEAEPEYTGNDAVTVGEKIYRPYKESDEESKTVYIMQEPNTSEYASTTIKFKKVTATESKTTTKYITKTETSGTDGMLTFEGLGEGTFTIVETKTPEGYNTAAPIKVVITADINQQNQTCVWKVGDGSDSGFRVTLLNSKDENGNDQYFVNIINKSGSLLPSTGGIGTTIFYIIGGILVVGAAILLITKKRMSREV